MRLLLTSLLVSTIATAQSPLPLTMTRAVAVALTPDGSTRVALAQESITQAEQKVLQAKSAFLPNLDASIQDRRQTSNLQAFGFRFDLPIPNFSIPTIVGPFSVLDARAAAQYSVLNFS